MSVAGVAISGTEDEDPAEYFDDHEDAGELLDLLLTVRRLKRRRRPNWKNSTDSQTCTLLSREEASDAGIWTKEKTESEHDSSRESSRVMKQCLLCSRQARLRSEHGTRPLSTA